MVVNSINRAENPLIVALRDIVRWLDNEKIEYMVFGGIANSVYGNPRQTFDIDIKISLEPQVASVAFIKAIQRIAEILPANPMDFFNETNVLPVRVGDVPVDIVRAELSYETAAIRRSVIIEYAGVLFKVCAPEDLIIQKVVSERRKDRDDIEIIIRRQSANLDREYLLKHCLDLSNLMERPDIYGTVQSLINEV